MKGSGRGASGGEEAAWRDLIANYEAEPEADGGPMPWPERENLPGSRRAGTLPDAGPDTDPSLTLDLSDDTDPALDLGPDPGGNSGPGPAMAQSPARPQVSATTRTRRVLRLPPLPVRRSTVPLRMDPVPPAATRTAPPPVPPQEAGRGSSGRPVPCRRTRRMTGNSTRRCRRRCPRWTRWPREPGPRCSAVLATCCWPPWSAGRSRAGPHSWPWPRSSAASRPW